MVPVLIDLVCPVNSLLGGDLKPVKGEIRLEGSVSGTSFGFNVIVETKST